MFRVRSDLLEREQEASKRAATLEEVTGEDSGGWFGRLRSVWKSGDTQLTNLEREIHGLRMLEQEMDKDLKELIRRRVGLRSQVHVLAFLTVQQDRIRFSRTWKGKIWKWVGWSFGLYCAFRVFSVRERHAHLSSRPTYSSLTQSLLHLIMRQQPTDEAGGQVTRTPDLITWGLLYVLSYIPLPASLSFLQHASRQQIAALSRQISLVMVGCIVLVSVRGVLRGVGGALRMVSGGSKQGPVPGGGRRALIANIMLLVLAQVMVRLFYHCCRPNVSLEPLHV